MIILGIETSCDDTGVSLYCDQSGLLGHKISSQVATHALYGGIVPELASRDHINNLLPLLRTLLEETKIGLGSVSGIAYTRGPGLAGALLVGATLAKSLSFSLNIPALGIHHLEGHLLSPFLSSAGPKPPFIALLVSGGHTQLVEVQKVGNYRIIGDTLDDAAGEAFDKTAKVLGLPFPGGAELSRLAKGGDAKKFKLPRPLLNQNNLNFSFSGLKTAVINIIKKNSHTPTLVKDIAASFQAAMTEVLVNKTLKALRETDINNLIVAGGVGANEQIRTRLTQEAGVHNFSVFYPPVEFCTDNAAMIAYAGLQRLRAGEKDNRDGSFEIKSRWSLTNIDSLNL